MQFHQMINARSAPGHATSVSGVTRSVKSDLCFKVRVEHTSDLNSKING